jgi:aspartyl-tRNA(Asn)/glutamyl-tRNA(Gln) amidotransferase subunit A
MTVLAVDYLQAMRIRSKVQQTLDKLYADFDALVSPARATVAYPISVNFQKAYPEVKGGAGPAVIPAGNLAGQPAISVPNGLGSNSLPTGIQFTGRAWSEARILAIAEAFQKRTDWHKKRPPLKA